MKQVRLPLATLKSLSGVQFASKFQPVYRVIASSDAFNFRLSIWRVTNNFSFDLISLFA